MEYTKIKPSIIALRCSMWNWKENQNGKISAITTGANQGNVKLVCNSQVLFLVKMFFFISSTKQGMWSQFGEDIPSKEMPNWTRK